MDSLVVLVVSVGGDVSNGVGVDTPTVEVAVLAGEVAAGVVITVIWQQYNNNEIDVNVNISSTVNIHSPTFSSRLQLNTYRSF